MSSAFIDFVFRLRPEYGHFYPIGSGFCPTVAE